MTRALAVAFALIVSTGAVRAAHWAPGASIRVWVDPAHAPAGADRLVERAMPADDIGTPRATGLSADDARYLRALYDGFLVEGRR